MATAAELLEQIRNDLDQDHIQDDAEFKKLESLKVLAREPTRAPTVYEVSGLRLIARIAFERQGTPLTSTEAASIIANALLLKPETQEVFASFDLNEKVVTFFSKRESRHEFVAARILFLLTYNSSIDFPALINSTQLADIIASHLKYHVETITKNDQLPDRIDQMALHEVAKLLYGLVNKCPDNLPQFTECSPSLLTLLSNDKLMETDPLFSALVNALACIDWVKAEDGQLSRLARRMISVVDRITQVTSDEKAGVQLEAQLVPPLTVLRKIVFSKDEEAIALLQKAILPSNSERDRPLGTSDTLPSRLLKLQLQPTMPSLSEAISGLLFELSDQDANVFVRNIGYGHAAGYLLSHNIPVPNSAHTGVGPDGVAVNPITGQNLSAEGSVDLPEMTDVEKEREAERLFVLFERLSRTGVVSTNPVAAAQQSGKLEELSDSDTD